MKAFSGFLMCGFLGSWSFLCSCWGFLKRQECNNADGGKEHGILGRLKHLNDRTGVGGLPASEPETLWLFSAEAEATRDELPRHGPPASLIICSCASCGVITSVMATEPHPHWSGLKSTRAQERPFC